MSGSSPAEERAAAGPLVSVVVPTYNRPAELRQCLAALGRQEFGDFEVCLVNDGGPSVAAVLAEATAAFPHLHLRLAELPANRGHVAARNHGLRMARGRYVAFCDDDDLHLPTHLADLVEAVAGGGCDLAYSDAEVVLFRRAGATRVPLDRLPFAFAWDPALLRRTNFVVPSAVLYRRSLHAALGFLDEGVAHHWDWDWLLRVARAGRVERVPRATVLYAVDTAGQALSARPELMRPSLERLAAKHGLGPLPVTNFHRMARDPALAPWRRPTAIVWDGTLPELPH